MESVESIMNEFKNAIDLGGEALYTVYRRVKKSQGELLKEYEDLDKNEKEAWALVFASTKNKSKTIKVKKPVEDTNESSKEDRDTNMAKVEKLEVIKPSKVPKPKAPKAVPTKSLFANP